MLFLTALITLALITLSECMGPIDLTSKLPMKYQNSVRDKIQKRSTTEFLTNNICPPTKYTREFWNQNAGTNGKLIGTWRGFGYLVMMNETTSDPILTATLNDTWYITFVDGHIDWEDALIPSIEPDYPPDHFVRYLQRDGPNTFHECTNTSNSSAGGSVDFDLDIFGYPVQISNLVNPVTGDYQAPCSYHFKTDTQIHVGCTYFDTLDLIPEGLVEMYYIFMVKDP